MDDIRQIALEATRRQGLADAQELAARAVSGQADSEELLASRGKIPTWRARDFSQVPEGTPYQFAGMVYQLRTAHNAAEHDDWTPPNTPALWAAVSLPGQTGTLDNPITAARGMEYTYGLYYLDSEDGKVYRCARDGETEGGKIILQYLPHEVVGQYFQEDAG